MNPALRLCAALLAIVLCTPALCWLILICADFIGLDDCLAPRPGWIMFASVSALALVLPPAMHAWPDFSRSPKEVLREGARAVLFAFSLFSLLFLAGARPFFAWLNIPAPMTSAAASNLALLLACPLSFLSYRLARGLLPIEAPENPVPAPMRRFGALALACIALTAFQPWLTGGEPLFFPNSLSLFCGAWIFLALRHVLLVNGEGGFLPLWATLCLFFAFRLGQLCPFLGMADLIVGIALILLATGSCLCLLHGESRRWFV